MAQEEDIKQNIILDYKTNALGVAKEVGVLSDTTEQVTDAKQKDTKATKENDVAYKSMRTQVKEATQEMYKLQEQYGLTSKEAIEATKKVAGLKDQMADAKSIVEGFNPDRKFQGLATAVNAAAVAASGITSGMALFGAESEETEKALLKVQAAMAFSDAVGRITEMGDDFTKLKAQIISMYSAMTTAKTVDTTATGANTVALESNAVAENQGFLAKAKNLAITTAQTVATGVATAAQWAWNAAMSANPIGALVIAIAAVVAGAYFLIKAFQDSSAESEKAVSANKALGKEIDNLSKSSKKQAEATESSQYQTMAMAKASGASAKEIRKLSEELINQEVAEKRVNAVKAYSIYLEAKRVAGLEDATDAQKEVLKKSIDSYNEINNAYKDSVKEKNKLLVDNRVAEVQETTDRQKELEKKQADHLKQLAAQKRQANEDAKKLEQKYLTDLENLKDKSEEEKLERQKNRDLAEIEALNQKGVDVRKLLILNTEKYNFLESDLKKKRELEIIEENKALEEELRLGDEERNTKETEDSILKLENAKYNFEEKARLAEENAKKEAEFETLKNEVIATSKQNLNNIMQGLEVAGLAKSKAGQTAQKALALAQIGIDTATAFSTAIPMALKAGQEAAKVSGPAAPIVGPIATGLSYAGSAAMIVSNVMKAKSIIGGGGGGVSSGGSSAPATPTGGSVPQVGFQSSSENQIATTLSANQQAQPPIQAFVVSSEVTTAQSLDRNKINANSLGG